jgi:hypothetical protein
MKQTNVTFPVLGLVAGTRVALGVGIGLLLANRLSSERRGPLAWGLLAIGALTTIPLALEVHNRAQLFTTKV